MISAAEGCGETRRNASRRCVKTVVETRPIGWLITEPIQIWLEGQVTAKRERASACQQSFRPIETFQP